jgi:predicted metal-binding protein
MSRTTKNLEAYLEYLCQKGKELGASEVIAIPVSDIVLDGRALLKCVVPLCSHYGIDLMCPPNVLPISEFRDILKCYQNAILIKVDIPVSNLPDGGEGEGLAGTSEAERMKSAKDAQKKLHDIVCRIESRCVEEEYHFSAGLIGGPCPLCEECVGIKSGLPCRYPFRARPAMEALGIDVMATAAKAGLRLGFGRDDGRSWAGLVLID